MRTRDDVEAYLAQSPYPFREIEEGTWLVQDRTDSGGTDQVVVRVRDDLVLFRMNVLDLRSTDPARREALFSMLLELNATDLLHGAYGVARNGDATKVVLTAAMRLENLDYSELVATLDDFYLAVARHRERLASFAPGDLRPLPASA